MLIATHDGSFHADETLACAIISFLYENCEVIRSRDPVELEKADIIIDVSGINDHKHFDHHSNAFNLSRDNGIHYATAGLMWKKFGHDFLVKIATDYLIPQMQAAAKAAKAAQEAEEAGKDVETSSTPVTAVAINEKGSSTMVVNDASPCACASTAADALAAAKAAAAAAATATATAAAADGADAAADKDKDEDEVLAINISDEIYLSAYERIDREIMYMVDLNDNGQLNTYLRDNITIDNDGEQRVMDELNEFYRSTPDIPYLVAMQNLPLVSNEEQNKNFLTTVRILKALLINVAINALNTEIGVAKVLEAYDGGPILVMHEKLPWTQAVLAHFDLFKNCMLAVYPDRKRGWRVQSLPFSKAERFKNKLIAPKAWRGLDDKALDAATGLSGTIFVHRAGFTGGALAFDTQMKMAQLWLEQGERPE